MIYKGSIVKGSGGGSGDAVWGSITGTLSDQTDLANALAGKQDLIDSTHKLSASLVDGLATVATTGAYSDLSNTPDLSTYVTTDTAQNITETKTFTHVPKNIVIKGGTASGAKYGISYYKGNTENAFLQYRNNDINSKDFLCIGNFGEASYLGFRNGGTTDAHYNLLTPLGSDAKTPFNLTNTFKDFYLPLGVTDGTTMVTTNSTGVLDISPLLSGGGSVSYDNTTINENSSNQLQTIGIIDQNSGNALQVWKGTETEWNTGSGQPFTWYQWVNIDKDSSALDNMFASKAVFGNGIYIAVGRNGAINSSYDGKYWNAETSGVNVNLTNATFGQGKFVTVGVSGTIITSTDGKSWTAQTSGTQEDLSAVAYNEGMNMFMVVGGNGTVLVGQDITSLSSINSYTQEHLRAVAVTQTGFMAVGDNDTIVEYDGSGCNASQTGTQDSWNGVAVYSEYNAGNVWEQIMIVGSLGHILSYDGHSWTTEYTGQTATFNFDDITYGSGRFVACSRFGLVYGNSQAWQEYSDSLGDNISFIKGKFYSLSRNAVILTFNDCYTDTPAVSSTPDVIIYDKPNEQSSLIFEFGQDADSMDLSNNKTYHYVGADTYYASVGYEHPDYICFVEGVGVKIGCKKF